MGIVYTERDKCTGCHACIRNCPGKAIRVREGVVEVIEERCIACGTCVHICLAKARQAESDTGLVWQLLAGRQPVIALLSGPFPAAFPELHPGQLVTALKKLGFSEVLENAFGAELVCREYTRLLAEDKAKTFLSSTCAAVVSYIEKYYPELIGNLAPIVSSMIASGRVIKWHYNPEAKVVFIGPCIARKAESRDEKAAGVVDAVITFAELKEMFAARAISPTTEEEGHFSGPKPYLGRLFAIAGGLTRAAGLSEDILLGDVINACGKEYTPKILREFAEGNITAKLISLDFCEGCIEGPVIDNDLSIFRRRELIINYTASQADPAQTERDIQKYAGIDLSREFTDRSVVLPAPKGEDIRSVLEEMGKLDPRYRMNCGACGYNGCRDLAIAICQGLAEPTMCWPYVLNKLKDSQEDLIRGERLTSLGEMAASIAHEVNNPLAGVLVYTQLMAKKLAADTISKEKVLEYLAKMDSELTRSSRLIRNLLDFARQSEPTFRVVNPNNVIERALTLIGDSADMQHIEVLKEMSPSLPEVNADFDQLQQVCMTLIMNALQAMPEGGRLTLRTSIDHGQLKIEIQDTGCGISQENMRKLFTPFFTTKGKGKGVGLGLAVAYGIIQRHQGSIEVESKEGKGSTFTIYLKACHEQES